MINCQAAKPDELNEWLALAREVEPLFGPMADLPEFKAALADAIAAGTALSACDQAGALRGGIVIDPKHNEIAWLAVAASARGQGLGQALLTCALKRLDPTRPVTVQTFDASCAAGLPARRLYQACGFSDLAPAEANPAGLPTVIMQRAAATCSKTPDSPQSSG